MSDYSNKLQKNTNKVTVCGRFIKGELKTTISNMKILSITIASNNDYQKADGTIVKKCNFFDVVFFNQKADAFYNEIKEKEMVEIEGCLDQQTWDDKTTGQKRSKIVINGFAFKRVDYKKKDTVKNDYNNDEDVPF